MRYRSVLPVIAIALALVLAISPLEWANAQAAPPPEQPFIAKVLPVAAGALVGGALGFFILPLILPATGATASAAAGAAVGPITSPLYGLAGASVGGFIGSRYAD